MTEKVYTGAPAPVEDGMRTDGGKGTFEWWYFDTEFEDGTTVAMALNSKNIAKADGGMQPRVRFDLGLPGKAQETTFINLAEGTPLDAATDHCDVKIGDCGAKRNDDGSYSAWYRSEDGKVSFDLTLTPTVPMWRPGDGFFRFGEKYFAWFVAVPSGTAKGTLTVDGETRELEGTGYHDHNWGNCGMQEVMDHWYWCRATIGGYTVIDCDIIGAKDYKYCRYPVFLVAKDGEILSDDSPIHVLRESTHIDPVTGKFLDDHLVFQQRVGGDDWVVEYFRERNIVDNLTLEGPKRMAAHLKGLAPSYVRMVGTAQVTRQAADGTVETAKSSALWEQMGFGDTVHPVIGESLQEA